MAGQLGVRAIRTAIIDSIKQSGWADRVQGHEVKNAPGNGLTAEVWLAHIGTVASGLDRTSVRLAFSARLRIPMRQEPQDDIDAIMGDATDDIVSDLSGNFLIDDYVSTVRMVDLLGAYGTGLSAEAGYLSHDNIMYRVMTITVPVIINDVWSQNA